MVKKEKILSDLDSVYSGNFNPNLVNILDNMSTCIENVTSIAILTEWDQFKDYNWKDFIKMKQKKVKI